MAFVFKRPKSKNWYIGWYDPKTGKTGTPISARTANKKLAEERARDHQRKLDRMKEEYEFKTLPDTTYILSEAFNLYVQDKQNIGKPFSLLTLDNYRTALNYLYRTVGDKKLYLYNKDDYNTFVSNLKVVSKDGKSVKEMAQNSKAVYTKCVFALFSWLAKEKYINENPMRRVAEERKPFTLPTQDEIKTILDYAKNTKYYDIIRFYILSAFRKMEAINLKWSGIEDNSITTMAKGGAMRTIPIISEMRDFLNDFISRNPIPKDREESVFNISPDMIHRFWLRCRKQTGLRDDISTHDLRKYCLSELANSGVPINFTQEYAGHRDIQMTMKYYIKVDKIRMVESIDMKANLLKCI